jgi:phosphoribosylformylglycinamidine cyclo-ligase
MSESYAAAGVDTGQADAAVDALVGVLRTIELDRPSISVLPNGHYASVLRVAPNLGIAVSTDGVGSKIVVAEQADRLETVGIDCIAMNVNDLVCVGAEPIAMLDYLAVEQADPQALARIALGLKVGAQTAGIEIPGGELAVLPELIRGHPSPHGFDLAGFCVGLVDLDAIVTGAGAAPGDAIVGLPSSGVHSNGLTLARAVLTDLSERPAELGGATVGETLLEPTVIYVRAVLELLRSGLDVRGLAHITGEGFLNLLRLEADVGYRLDALPEPPPVFRLISERGDVDAAELYEVFNMGCGFCCVVAADNADAAVALLAAHHPGAAVVGHVTGNAGVVELPDQGLAGTKDGGLGRLP